MNKFGLIGKNIKHSKSPALYKEFISENITYDLLDYAHASEIPKVTSLLDEYDGINITAPYKEHFLNDVVLTDAAKKLQAINCLGKKNDVIVGENTDYLAIKSILKKYSVDHKNLEIIILGDGVMSRVLQIALEELSLDFKVYSRKSTPYFENLNLKQLISSDKYSLIINSCSRDFVCQFPLPEHGEFWDLNYNFPPHLERFSKEKMSYVDGMGMLRLQAEFAVAFWSTM